MALVICRQCRGPVADNAPYCPHCGAPREAEEFSFGNLMEHIRRVDTAQTNLPLFLGAAVGVLAVLGLHYVLQPQVRFIHVIWQTALGALIGCLVGTMVRKKKG